jgi:nitrite reductase (NADH) large subunit
MGQKFVIVGNGVAGITAARTIAQVRPNSKIEVYTQETYPYYSRPRLWEFLAEEIEQDDLYFYPTSWYERRGIQVHLGSLVTQLDPDRRELTLHDGHVVPYERLLLATGSHPFVPPIAGVAKEGVFTLRTIEDVMAMKAYARGATRAIAIGGGLLGLETARALRMLGLEVTVLELFSRLLPRQLDDAGANLLARLIGDMGLEVVTSALTEAILGAGRATGVALKNGDVIKGDLILVSAGVRPNLKLPQAAGLAVNRGVIVDDYLQTSAEGIYAIGDVAEHQSQVYGIIPACIEQARVAGAHMAGGEVEPYAGTVPSNTLKIVGIHLTSIGTVNPDGEGYQELFWLKEPDCCYKKFVLQDGRLVGAILLGLRGDVTTISRLIASGVDVSAHKDRLLDEDFDLKSLLVTR